MANTFLLINPTDSLAINDNQDLLKISRPYDISVEDIVGASAVIPSLTLKQLHYLIAESLNGVSAQVDDPTLGQIHGLIIPTITGGVPVIASPLFNWSIEDAPKDRVIQVLPEPRTTYISWGGRTVIIPYTSRRILI